MGEITIELNEKLTPQQNAERYFKRYQKARDSVAMAQQRKGNVVRELDLLESAREDAEKARTVDALRDLRKSLTEQDLLRQEIVQEKQEAEFGGEKIRRYYTPDGWEILYGENSKANDYLTQRVARPNDVWLHARQIIGAHVVIRTAGHGRRRAQAGTGTGVQDSRAELGRETFLACPGGPHFPQIRPQTARGRAGICDLSQREDDRYRSKSLKCARARRTVKSQRAHAISLVAPPSCQPGIATTACYVW